VGKEKHEAKVSGIARCEAEIARIERELSKPIALGEMQGALLGLCDWHNEKRLLSMRTVIGLCGAAGAGKDEVARILGAQGFVKRSFAEALRLEVNLAMIDSAYRESLWPEMPPIVREWFETCYAIGDLDPWAKPTSIEMRGLLQTWGTEFRRSQDDDYWTKREMQLLPSSGMFVYTDARFPNECEMIRSLGGKMFRVERAGVRGNGHISESYWPHFECEAVIRNDGTLQELRENVMGLAGIFEASLR
jgi:hypothetical protein